MTTTERLDIELVVRSLARSRNHAHQLIEQGRVLVDGKPAVKPAAKVSAVQSIEVTQGIDYVSRAGQKLVAALDAFAIQPSGWTLDAGASTGGFTQVLLERGAEKVVAIDVGTDQLDESLRADKRVLSLEGVNLRHLNPSGLLALLSDRFQTAPPLAEFKLVVADLSFISLTLVLENLRALAPFADMVLLVKPQFEVGKQSLKAGIVTDAPERERAILQVTEAASALGHEIRGLIESPTTGTHGNVEYLLWISPTGVNNQAEWQQAIHARARRQT